MSPKISVVIPNKDDSKYIERCINSVLEQSVLPDEIIFIDDHSTDNSLDIVNRIKESSQLRQFTVIKNDFNLGVMKTLNVGLNMTSSDYVIFLASNDSLAKGIVEEAKIDISSSFTYPGVWSALVRLVDSSGNSLGAHRSPLVSTKTKFIPPLECFDLALKLGNWFTGSTTFFNVKQLREIGGFDARLKGLADNIAALTLSFMSGAIFSPKIFGNMTIHSDNYLHKTLIDPNQIEFYLNCINERGRIVSNNLFDNPRFKKITKKRLYFASIREQLRNGATVTFPVNKPSFLRPFEIFSKLPVSKKIKLYFAYFMIRPNDVLCASYFRLKNYIFVK